MSKTNQVKKRALYNLDEDIREGNDLSAKHPEMVSRLEKLIHAHKKSVQANLRPAGEVAKPVLIKTDGVPSLSKLRGQEDAEYVKGKW